MQLIHSGNSVFSPKNGIQKKDCRGAERNIVLPHEFVWLRERPDASAAPQPLPAKIGMTFAESSAGRRTVCASGESSDESRPPPRAAPARLPILLRRAERSGKEFNLRYRLSDPSGSFASASSESRLVSTRMFLGQHDPLLPL